MSYFAAAILNNVVHVDQYGCKMSRLHTTSCLYIYF